MSKIEDLISEIADLRLREEIAREVAALKKQKKFGLVFEEHIPEQVQLPGLPVKQGLRVVRRGGNNKEVFTVQEVLGNGKARIRRENGDAAPEPETVKASDLVVIKRFGEAIYPTLVPVARLTRAPGKPYHTLINADNFHALQLLLYCYAGQVDVIYIDPPYNTGARDWKYNNDYVDSTDQWRHSKWLSMMKKRLVLGRLLLKPDGILVVAIDDCEVHHLRSLIDDQAVIGEQAFLGTLVVRSKPSGNQTTDELAISHEYALYYGTGPGARIKAMERSVEQISRFDQTDQVGRFYWENFRRHGAHSRQLDRPRMFYPIWVYPNGDLKVPNGQWDKDARVWGVSAPPKGVVAVYPLRGSEDRRVWALGPETARSKVGELEARIVDGQWQVYRKVRMRRGGVMPQTVWTESRYSAAEHGTNVLKAIFGEAEKFSYPKSIYTVLDCLRCASSDPNALIVDFFAGSATTYHATALLNAEDGGSRRCVLVTNNEVDERTSKDLSTKSLFPGEPDFEKHGICESVTWPRCKFVTQGHRDDGTPLPGSYLDGREMKEGFEENIEYFKLDFLDPHEVAYGEKFEAIVPILWLMAGAKGERETARGYGKWFIPKDSPFAVLIKEEHFADFRRELEKRPDIAWVFLVTDSEEAYREMVAALPGRPQPKMLYKSYLDNFRINTEKSL
ncbi:MAG: site-specific DNA-methyltransferase [Planctomycetes bacterium]|nr:site-specific DNA-methyltransferase [Planctomycetota bacterium]